MTTHTVRGLPTTAASATVAEDFAAVVAQYCAFDPAVGPGLQAVREADPEMPMALALQGAFQMMFGTAASTAKARATHAELTALLGRVDATPRERLHADAIGAWADGQLTRAILAWEQVLTDHPTDLLALRLAHHLHFYSGNAERLRDSVARVLPAWDETHPDWGHVLATHAFGLEEAGDYAAAEATGREAVRVLPDNPWAIHAVAHVCEMQGRTADGITWVRDTEPQWAGANNFRLHIVWHRCLFHLEEQDYDTVLKLLDGQVASDLGARFQLDQANVASLLARLQLHGVDVGERWGPLADICAGCTGDRELVFMGLHHLLALLAAGRHAEAGKLLANLRGWAGEDTDQGRATRDTGLAVATGLAALTAGEAAQALQAFDQALPGLERIGGSRAQRDLFHMLALHASRMTGNLEDFGHRLAERRSRRPVDGWPFAPA